MPRQASESPGLMDDQGASDRKSDAKASNSCGGHRTRPQASDRQASCGESPTALLGCSAWGTGRPSRPRGSPQVFFAASVWPGGRLHLRGGPLDSTNRADSQRTAHTGCRNRKLGAEATRYSSLTRSTTTARRDPRVGASPGAREPALGLAADRRRSAMALGSPSPRHTSPGPRFGVGAHAQV